VSENWSADGKAGWTVRHRRRNTDVVGLRAWQPYLKNMELPKSVKSDNLSRNEVVMGRMSV
jgi:hypothetical protein